MISQEPSDSKLTILDEKFNYELPSEIVMNTRESEISTHLVRS
jgi:hypothetical protein